MRLRYTASVGMLAVATILAVMLAASPTSGQKEGFQKGNKAAQVSALDRLQTNPNSVNLVSDSVTNLAQKIAQAIASPKSKTEIFSPVSIAGALSLLLLGAGGRTQKELLSVMGFRDGQLSFQEIHYAFGRLFQDLVANDPTLVPLVTWRKNDKCNRYDQDDDYYDEPANATVNTLPYDYDVSAHETSLANGVFLHQDYRLSSSYRQQSEQLYNSEVQSLDFAGEPVGATKRINDWVSEKTHGKIPHILGTTLAPSTSLVLASAMYFKALWEETFILGATKPREFFPDGKQHPSVMVDMMGHGGCFPFHESSELDARILGLSYKNRLATMYVIMPNHSNRDRLRDLMAKLDATALDQMIGNMTMKTTILLFPKMHITNTMDLKSVLEKINVHTLFRPDLSNLSAMVTETLPAGDYSFRGPEGATLSPSMQQRPTLNTPVYVYNRKPTTNASNNLNQQLVFSRIDLNDSTTDTGGTEPLTMDAPATTNPQTTETPTDRSHSQIPTVDPTAAGRTQQNRSKREVTYKAPGGRHTQDSPLGSKDFILRKRIVKEKGPVAKKSIRRRTKRSEASVRNLYVSSAVHQIDLEINETGTEGGAATVVALNRSGTSVVFRADGPFLLVIRNENTKLPLFYGAVFDPTN